MKSKERIDAVVSLEAPDRVPVGPLLDHYAATYTGITNAELMRDGDKRIAAVIRTMRELGPWDLSFLGESASASLLTSGGIAAKLRIPGKDLTENEVHQVDEVGLLGLEDYEWLIDKGLIRFMLRVRKHLGHTASPWRGLRTILSLKKEYRKHVGLVESAGAQVAVGAYLRFPFEYFSIGRGMQAFYADILHHKDLVRKASKKFRETFTPQAIRTAEGMGVPRLFVGLARSSSSMISPGQMEEFVWPDLEYVVNAGHDAGMTTILHCDTNWSKALPLFRRLPRKSCILELDGATDIFNAKEVLGDHFCIMGDVPASLLAFGTKDRVMAYCKRLIQEVGKGGGFILSSGCSIPANASADNVRALVEAAEEWGYY